MEGLNLPLPFELLCTLVLIPVGLNPITFCFRVDPAKTSPSVWLEPFAHL